MRVCAIIGLIGVLAAPVAYGDMVTFNSGAGVHFLDSGNTSTDFASAFTAANFAAAQTGPLAFVLTSTPFWISSLPADPAAKWLGTNATAGTNVGDTALYAISFNIPDPFASGSFTLNYAVDNELGDLHPGIYLNGIALPSSTGIGTFSSQFTYTDSSVGADLMQGTNWLYIDAVNLGAPAGLIFSATVRTVNATTTVPEPSTVLLLASCALCLVPIIRRKLRVAQGRG
jgi:hypothetical protein